MAAALSAVKAELGDTAVLLKTRALDPKLDGKSGFEVTAALDTEPVAAARIARPAAAAPAAAVPAIPAGPLGAPEVLRCLASRGVEELLARRLADAWQKKSRFSGPEQLTGALAALIPVTGESKLSGQPHVIALVGPTGVGKTTSLAKLAAHFVLDRKLRVQLLSADTHRIAALEQLEAFARLLGADFEAGYDAAEVGRHRENSKAQVVLLDTPGVGPLDDAGLQYLEKVLLAARPHETHLCLSASVRTPDLRLAATRFAALGCDRLIFTKLDETATAGQVLTALAETRLPVSCWTSGQIVPGDYEMATPEGMARLILGGLPDVETARARQGA